MSFANAVRRFLHARRLRRYFQQPAAERSRIIKANFSQVHHESAINRYLKQSYSGKIMDRSPYFDLLLGYAQTCRPAMIHQIGCFTASECRFLIDHGYTGSLVASDFDSERLAFLRKRFASTPYHSIEFRQLDLEGQNYAALAGATMVCGLAVLANIQPESVELFFGEAARQEVSLILLNDIATPASLALRSDDTASIPSTMDYNWYHRFLALGRKHGFEPMVLPDFGPGAGAHARCNFVLSKGLSRTVHSQAVSMGMDHYLQRQGEILRHIA